MDHWEDKIKQWKKKGSEIWAAMSEGSKSDSLAENELKILADERAQAAAAEKACVLAYQRAKETHQVYGQFKA